MATQDRALRTRQRIISATAKLINERNYERASTKDIAERAGVTAGALYFHFSTKEEIAHAVIEEQHNRSQLMAKAIHAKRISGIETLLQTTAQFTRDILEDPLMEAGVRLTTQPQMFENPPILPWTSWAAINTELLSRGVEEGDVKPTADPHLFATHINGA
jgi:AcrR family transcriptional regulator